MDGETLLILNVVLSALAAVAAAVAAWIALRTRTAPDSTALHELVEDTGKIRTMVEVVDRAVRLEAASGRTEAAGSAKELREEVRATLGGMLTQMRGTLEQIGSAQQGGLEGFSNRLAAAARLSEESAKGLRGELLAQTSALTENTARGLDTAATRLAAGIVELKTEVGGSLRASAEFQSKAIESLKNEQRGSTMEFMGTVQNALVRMTDEQTRRFDEFSKRIGLLTEQQERAADGLRATMNTQLAAIQKDNEAKLDQIRLTVDDKLSSTLNQRLGDTFKQVTDQLANLQSGLGEMKSLSAGVTDLRRVMTNVKSRGTWGEFQLANLLSQVLTPDQYVANFRCNERTQEMVEFAVRLPGKAEDGSEPVWLPIDSKFPTADYERLLAAADAGDADEVSRAAQALENRVYDQAKAMSAKYLNPPRTTDWGILFLPTEGLYAEVLRRPGVVEMLHQECRMSVAGPTTLAAVLNAFQMGFRTMAIQKKSGEVWKTLSAVKSQFVMFRELLDKAKKNLDKASGDLDDASHRTRQIEKKLRKAEELPAGEAERLLLPGAEEVE